MRISRSIACACVLRLHSPERAVVLTPRTGVVFFYLYPFATRAVWTTDQVLATAPAYNSEILGGRLFPGAASIFRRSASCLWRFPAARREAAAASATASSSSSALALTTSSRRFGVSLDHLHISILVFPHPNDLVVVVALFFLFVAQTDSQWEFAGTVEACASVCGWSEGLPPAARLRIWRGCRRLLWVFKRATSVIAMHDA
jgi:hypothetical protein